MPRRPIAERLTQLDAQRKTLQARLSKQERARDTRRKVLIGALVLHKIEKDPNEARRLGDWLRHELPGFLTRDMDKALFADLLKQDGVPEDSERTPSLGNTHIAAESAI